MYPTPQQIKNEQIYTQMGVNNNEYDLIVTHLDGRLPNYTELGIFSVMWSEHCSYKNSKNQLKKLPTAGKYVLQGPGEGAGIVDIGNGLAVVFKIESHNHPSAIEPFQGAATGVGGIIRDVFSMGARPIALLNSLRFGELNTPRTKYLFENIVKGIAAYGNCVGVPTVGGEIYFDDCYAANPLVNAMCVGLIKHTDIQKGIAVGIGNSVVYVGSSTGKDGIHGATFASEELSEKSEQKRPSVQVGDPFMEKLLIEACLEVINHPKLIGIQDMGAAGLTCSLAEMASKGNVGIELNLDLVPQRETNMTPYEIMLSESQERMLLIVEKGYESQIQAIFHRWDLYATTIGTIIEQKILRLTQKGETIAQMPVHALTQDAPIYDRDTKIPGLFLQNQAINYIPDLKGQNIEELFHKIMASPTIASKKYVFEQYDYMVQTNTIAASGQSDAAVIRIRNTKQAIAITVDGNARYVYLNPHTGGQIAVAEAVRNIVASGAIPIGLTDGLNYGNPENPEIFWQLEQSIEGIAEACKVFEVPVVGGNVSLYNERSMQGAVFPTPIIGMVGLIDDLKHITTQKVKNLGDKMYLIGDTKAEFGGSELQKLLESNYFGKCPEINLEKAHAINQKIIAAIRLGIVCSVHDLAEGGLAVALVEKLFETDFGMDLIHLQNLELTTWLFSESQNRYLITIDPKDETQLLELFKHEPIQYLGAINDTKTINFNHKFQVSISELQTTYQNALEQCLKNS